MEISSSDLNSLVSLSKGDDSGDDEPCSKKFKSDDTLETCESKLQAGSLTSSEAKSATESLTNGKTEAGGKQPFENGKSGDDMEMESIVESTTEETQVEHKAHVNGSTFAAIVGCEQGETTPMPVSEDVGVNSENKLELSEEGSAKEGPEEEIAEVEKDVKASSEAAAAKESSEEEISEVEKDAIVSSEAASAKESSEEEISEVEKDAKVSSEVAVAKESSEEEIAEVDKDAKANSKEESSVDEAPALEEQNGKAKCWSCNKNEAIYTCPGCLTKTCSLPCVRLHKEKKNCSGVRNPVAFIEKSEYNEADFISDYRFLEKVNQQLTRQLQDKRTVSKSWMNKKINAARFHRVNLHFLPVSFTRSKCNRSHFNFKTQHILWDVEWIFLNGDIKKHQHRCYGERSLYDTISKYMDLHAEEYDYKLDEYLKVKRSETSGNFRFYLHREFQPANRRYRKLEGDNNLYQSLQGQEIVEFPRIYVVLPKHFDRYESSVGEEAITATHGSGEQAAADDVKVDAMTS